MTTVYVFLGNLGKLLQEWADRRLDRHERPIVEQVKDAWAWSTRPIVKD